MYVRECETLVTSVAHDIAGNSTNFLSMADTEIASERFGKKSQREISINKVWKTIKIGYNGVKDKIYFLIKVKDFCGIVL
jgi:hypothetical protein